MHLCHMERVFDQWALPNVKSKFFIKENWCTTHLGCTLLCVSFFCHEVLFGHVHLRITFVEKSDLYAQEGKFSQFTMAHEVNH
jgi:hypothetical protein